MDVLGDRRFVEIPGDKLHELPPLMVCASHGVKRLDKVVDMANDIVQSEELLSEAAVTDWTDAHEAERRRMDLAITIRTCVIADGVASVQTGAGIVADSVAEREWEETENKARALLTAIGQIR